MEKIYTATVTARGGRSGHVESPDQVVSFDLHRPSSMGGEGGGGLNPELLFAAGYSACFDSALARVIRTEKLPIASTTVTCEVGLLRNEEARYFLSVALRVTVPGYEPAQAEALVEKAHRICPYSNAIHGNIEVAFTVSVR
jgi:osmotically inducible protein OsmC